MSSSRAITSERESQLRRFAERYTAAWCSQNPARVAEFYAPNGSLRINANSPPLGREAITGVAQGFMSAFPDMKVVMDELVFHDDHVAYHWRLTGTNNGSGGSVCVQATAGCKQWV